MSHFRGSADNAIKRSIQTISVMMVLVLTAKISGFVRQILILRYMGTSPEGQAFAFASQIPVNFMDIAFAAAVSAGFIPVFNAFLEKKPKDEAFALANTFITFVTFLALAATAIIFLAAHPIAAAFLAAEGGPETTAMAANLLRILTFTIVTTTAAFALIGVLQSLGGFYTPSIMSIIPNAFVLAYLFLFFDQLGVFGLAAAFIIGNILQLIIFILPLRKRGFTYRPSFNFRNAGLVQILRLAPMALVAAWLFPISSLINNWVISNHDPVALVELTAANNIYIVVAGFFVLSVTNVLFPKLSKEAAKDKSQFSTILSGSISGVAFILIPLAVGLFVLRQPIMGLIQGGELTPQNAQNAARALGYLAAGMLGFGLVTVLSRAFFALMDGKIPMITSFAAIIINFVIATLLVSHMGIAAPALASSISLTIAGLAMFVIISRKFPIFSKAMATNLCKMAISAAIMFVALGFTIHTLSFLPDIALIGIIAPLGIIIYANTSLLLHIDEAKLAKMLISAKLRKDA